MYETNIKYDFLPEHTPWVRASQLKYKPHEIRAPTRMLHIQLAISILLYTIMMLASIYLIAVILIQFLNL
jgi:hypothetical protein